MIPAIIALLSACPGSAQEGRTLTISVEAPAEPGAIPLYGDETPGSASTEDWTKFQGEYVVRNVTRPTLTPFLPDAAKATGAAAVVAPGGAFMQLSMESEGWKVAKALAERGIAAFVLKYRILPTPKDNDAAAAALRQRLRNQPKTAAPGALPADIIAPEDALAALEMVRGHAGSWGVNPARVGMIGFSAGAITARRVALDAPPASRPAFIGYIYGPQVAEPVPADAPPLFDAIALDDRLIPADGFAIAKQWLDARRPVEIHAYQRGGHGFGTGAPGTTTTLLIDEFTAWLSMQGFLARKEAP
ncbi:alpha/beta hydrolase [Novosphingobium album (ex Hu et al. 2023)]|uniref:Dienelactone hydrolase family protein n=1 Tax=Novosphingobium album (ex Hu et al. 2023) TaxID=2930093 RepID=A0ABT0B5C7_9SPHN|nr:dienelactone hydrolase family protein [Novosphingobium album (ex Hu et al. 2023)]MCJ2180277.1 dienelactone hydrolase family protein [Novosphingobium album (ex Hu et al. 2023)]